MDPELLPNLFNVENRRLKVKKIILEGGLKQDLGRYHGASIRIVIFWVLDPDPY